MLSGWIGNPLSCASHSTGIIVTRLVLKLFVLCFVLRLSALGPVEAQQAVKPFKKNIRSGGQFLSIGIPCVRLALLFKPPWLSAA